MVRQQAQIGLEDEPLADEVLEKALEDWQACKERKKGPVKAFNAINTTVKALIERKELSDGTYRCGPFVIKISPIGEKEIAFERTARRNVSIKQAKT